MDTVQTRKRSIVIILLIAVILTGCQRPGASSPEGDSGSDGGSEASQPSGEAGTATIRIMRSGSIRGQDVHWEVNGEFPMTLYFDPDDTSPIFWSQGQGTAVMASSNTSPASGITINTTAIFDVEFEVRGAFNASDCSIEIYVKETWDEGAEVVAEANGVVLEGTTDEFIIFTTNTYEYKSIKFPYGVGIQTVERTIGNVDWQASFEITSLVVPEHTNCGTFDYLNEELDSPDNGN
jgi:hypothetical protein